MAGRALPRRAFLRWTTGAAVGAALSGCSSHHGRAAPTTTSRVTSGPPSSAGPPPWQELQASLAGRLVRPDDATYLSGIQLYDSRYDGVRPAGLAYCANPTDVQRCVGFARDHGIPVAMRSGGHSYGGYSVGPGLVVDVTSMHQVVTSNGQATIGAGARLIDAYTILNGQGVSIPGGSCPTVGIAGLALGGGEGVVSRAHGLTCDALVGVQMVTADGRLVSADETTNSDLLWACRGGGGGNFGIVTSFTFATFPTSDVTLTFLSWPWQAAGSVLAAWMPWAAAAPDPVWSNCVFQTDPSRPAPQASVGVVWLGASGAAALVDALVRDIGSAPASRSSETVAFSHAMYVEAGCAELSEAECHLPSEAVGGVLTRQPSLAKSDYFNLPLSGDAVQAIVSGIDARRQQGGRGTVGFDAYGGVVNRVAPDATAFAHRGAAASAQYGVPFTPADSAVTLAQGQVWLDQWYASLRPYANGQAYQNYIDPRLDNWAQAYYGANLPRLQQVKRSWDPDDVWRFAQSIPLPA